MSIVIRKKIAGKPVMGIMMGILGLDLGLHWVG